MVSAIDTVALQPVLRQEKARRDLLTFAERMDPRWQRAPHLAALAEQLQRLERREIRRLFVAMPPRHGKTELASRKFVAWYFGRNPSHQVILASYASELSEGNSRAVRTMMEDDSYPFQTRLREDSRSVGRFETIQKGVLVAVGVGSGLTGRGGDLIIADDLLKGPQEADSEATRASTAAWWQEVLMTRQMPNAAILLIGTRWREDDIMGMALESGGDAWTKLVLPFEAEENDALGREPGELLWPARFTRDDVPSVEKGDISSRAWSALYQGRPTAAEGNLFKREWFNNRYKELPPLVGTSYPGSDRVVVSDRVTITALDAASKTGSLNDFSVFVTVMTDGISIYIVDVFRDKLEFPKLVEATKKLQREQRPRLIYAEDASNATALVQQLRAESRINIVAVRPDGSKEARANAVTNLFEAGKVLLPERAHWVDAFVDEMCSFPNGRHDDQVDACVLALRKIVQGWNSRGVDARNRGIWSRSRIP